MPAPCSFLLRNDLIHVPLIFLRPVDNLHAFSVSPPRFSRGVIFLFLCHADLRQHFPRTQSGWFQSGISSLLWVGEKIIPYIAAQILPLTSSPRPIICCCWLSLLPKPFPPLFFALTPSVLGGVLSMFWAFAPIYESFFL